MTASTHGPSSPWRLLLSLLVALVFLPNSHVIAQTLTPVKLLAIPMLANTTQERLSFTTVTSLLRQSHNIDLVVDLAPTLSTTDYASWVGSLLRINSSEHDLVMIDVVWPGQWADSFLDLSSVVSLEVKRMHVESIYDASNVDGRQVGVPYFADFGLLYYRSDLLLKYNFTAPPRTWEEMENIMAVIVPAERHANPMFQGYAGQYNAYEGLTCNFLEWVHSADGGRIIETNKNVTVNSDPVAKVVSRIKSWLLPPKSFTPLSSLLYDETASYQLWLNGNLLFLRNWPFVYSLTQSNPTFPTMPNSSVKAFNITRLPGVTASQSASTLGGWQLAINRNSKQPDAAAKALLALTTKDFQMERYRTVGVLPTLKDLYDDPEFCTLNPNCKLFGSLQVAPRPAAAAAPYYLSASEQIYLTANKILRDEITVADGLSNMTVGIRKAIRTYVDPSSDLGPPVFVAFTDPLALTLLSFAGLLTLLSIFLFLYLLRHRRHPRLRSTSPLFLLLMVFGTLLAHAAMVVYTGEPNRLTCLLQPWLVVAGYGLTVSALVVRCWRIYKIFRNKYLMKLRLKDADLLRPLALLLAVEVVLLVLWTVLAPPVPALVKLPNSQFWTCSAGSKGWGFVGALVGYNAALLGFGVWLAVGTRRVLAPWNESKWIGYTVYTLVLLNGILIPLSYLDVLGARLQYLFRGVGIELSTLAVTANMLLPKVWDLMRDKSPAVGATSGNLSEGVVANEYALTPSRRRRQSRLSGSAALSGWEGLEEESGRAGSVASDDKVRAVKSTISETLEGTLYVRTAKSKIGLTLASWRDMRVIVLPMQRIISMYPLESPMEMPSTLSTPPGLTLPLHAVDLEDLHPIPGPGTMSSISDDDSFSGLASHIFRCVVNGTTWFEMQASSRQQKDVWMGLLRGVSTGAGTGTGTGK
ncbi:hypothetical protein HDU96_002607 [Phlyctochytrium bullatum]|nr:hypothetical protein HDU96_002607 [Phlyctochytrium bullatum]